MPVKLITESALDLSESDELLTADGELTLEAQAVSDFLTHADFTAVFERESLAKHISTLVGGKVVFGESVTNKDVVESALTELSEGIEESDIVQVISIADALDAIDEGDLDSMFLHYADTLPDATLEDRSRRAAVANVFGLEEFARGAFRKVRKKPGGVALVKRMLGAMKNKGLITRSAKGSGYKGGDWDRTASYKGGAKKSNLQKVARFKKANAAKMKKVARQAKKAKKNKMEAVDDQDTGTLVFGLNAPVDGFAFEVACVAETVSAGAARVVEAKPETMSSGGELMEGARLAAGMVSLHKPKR